MRIETVRGGLAATLLLAAANLCAAPAPLAGVARVAAGTHHSCAADDRGGVSCWGANSAAQLGLGPTAGNALRPTPVPVPGLAGVLGLASGYAHTCAITAARGVVCWGLNFAGQAGDASLGYTRDAPGPVAGLPASVIEVATGDQHSCALLEGGEVRCWGGNDFGQLGDGQGAAPRASAAPVDLGGPARAIAAGSVHSCAVLVDGRVSCWGRNNQGQLGDGSTTDRPRPTAVQGLPGPVSTLALASGSSCALTAAGGVACWGPQYPLGAFPGGSLLAREYPGFERDIAAIVAGANHYCALARSGGTRCFGDNAYGQFGTGPIDGSLGVENVVDLAPDVTQLAAGGSHTCARNARGGLQCWGDNSFGQLGIDATSLRLVPTPVAGLGSGVAMVGSGGYHGCALTTAGGVKCWGTNPAVGDGTQRLRLTPVDVAGLTSGVLALETGVRSNCVITAQRRAKCWGANFAGQLGIGQRADSALAGDVVGLGDVDVLALGVGRDHACALLAGGAVKCWGSNEYGQVGDGSDQTRLVAVAVTGLDAGVRAISVGWLHSCAVTLDGAMKCWGFNGHGQLGDDSTTHRATPVDVVGLSGGVLAIGAGGVQTCATTAGGALKCWGDIGGGNTLGDGGSGGRRVPGDVPALRSGVVAISASLFGTCARLDDGALQCWGANDGGDLGDNGTITRPLPIQVPGLNRGVTHVDGSYGNGGHTCAVVAGAAKCWGENIFAQVGDGTTHGVPTAQTVVTNEVARRVSVVDEGANAAGSAAQVDASGRFVVFQSDADNLVPGDTNGASDIFRLDRETDEVIRVSVDTTGAQLSGASREPSISADGRYVVFVAPDSAARELSDESRAKRAARHKSAHAAVLLRNLVVGTTQRLGPVLAAGGQPRIAPNAAAVAFTATPASAQEGAVGQPNVYVVTLARSGEALVPASPRCVSCKSGTAPGTPTAADANAPSGSPALSADGQWLVYQSAASNALADSPAPCPAGNGQVLLRNLVTGATQRVSPPPTLPASACGTAGSQRPSIDYAGQTIAWQTDQGLVPGDNNGLDDAYVWRAAQPAPLRVSLGGDGVDTAGAAQSPQLSGDGRHVVFVSAASNHDLGTPDNNDRSDLHSVSLDDPSQVRRLSRTSDGGEANAASQAPAVSFDGSQLAFHSAASNLASGAGGRSAVFSRDNPLSPARKSATWWIPGESGWGLTVFDQGNLLAPTWFTYDSDGEPTWFIVGGAFPQPDGSFRGDVLRLTGVPFDRIAGNATLSARSVGSVTLQYEGEGTLRFGYRVDGIEQSKMLERFPFGARDFVCSGSPSADRSGAGNYTDLWTGVDGGWGLTLFHVDDLLVAIWYTYDLDGEAVFFVISGTRQPDGSFGGQVFRQRDGTPFSAIDGNRPSTGADPVGTATFRFGNGQAATFSYVVNGVAQSRAIARLLVGNQAQACRSTDAN